MWGAILPLIFRKKKKQTIQGDSQEGVYTLMADLDTDFHWGILRDYLLVWDIVLRGSPIYMNFPTVVFFPGDQSAPMPIDITIAALW